LYGIARITLCQQFVVQQKIVKHYIESAVQRSRKIWPRVWAERHDVTIFVVECCQHYIVYWILLLNGKMQFCCPLTFVYEKATHFLYGCSYFIKGCFILTLCCFLEWENTGQFSRSYKVSHVGSDALYVGKMWLRLLQKCMFLQ